MVLEVVVGFVCGLGFVVLVRISCSLGLVLGAVGLVSFHYGDDKNLAGILGVVGNIFCIYVLQVFLLAEVHPLQYVLVEVLYCNLGVVFGILVLHHALCRILAPRYALCRILAPRYALCRILAPRHALYRILVLRYALCRILVLRYALYRILSPRYALCRILAPRNALCRNLVLRYALCRILSLRYALCRILAPRNALCQILVLRYALCRILAPRYALPGILYCKIGVVFGVFPVRSDMSKVSDSVLGKVLELSYSVMEVVSCRVGVRG